MKTYFTKTPNSIMRFFSKYVWRFSLDTKEIYLTFDDGPTPEITDFVLDALKKYNAKATFFCIGKNIVNHPDIFNRIIIEGHAVGNHTQNHLKGWSTENEVYLENVEVCEKTITRYGNATIQPKIFRPPYGKIKKSQAKEILKKGYKIIMWTVLSADFDTSISKEKCLQNVLKNTKNGSIIVFHDSIKAAEKVSFVLPKVLKEFSKQGFTFKAI
ncbi:polysaccharide deacetylase family protein [Polaribacter sp. IC073]|uniref:polysaccharide deacetylase family protein n=1 Tax=Polaribacter sp. IC073 TaxID=2508540 RepID=UPI0011BF81B5|nr:polysaccharide deacetylase family protein [Polaribacter sp. IC073]TXD49626.1 polysaccharide deacetylase family protein [Polaribacter sp. IC073]